ncbi:hypothetical protein [Compostibacter hankyongensis]
MKFQITKRAKWRIFFRQVCISCTICGVAIAVLVAMIPELWWICVIAMLIWMFLFDIGPGIYLYNEYIKHNKYDLLCVDIENETIRYQNIKEEAISVNLSEIKKISIYIPPNNFRNTITLISMEEFSFARFELKDGKTFLITCLMIPKLKDFIIKNFPETFIDFHKGWIFPSIRLVNRFYNK